MEKLNKYLVVFLIAMMSAYTIDGFSQNTKTDREIVIVKKTIDADGVEKVEKNVFQGNEMSDEDLEKIIESDLNNIEIDIHKIEGKPRLGVMVEKTNDGTGVMVVEVVKDSPASEVGIKVGDIISAVGESHVENLDDLITALEKQGPKPILVWSRDGKRMSEVVTLLEGPIKERIIVKKVTKTDSKESKSVMKSIQKTTKEKK